MRPGILILTGFSDEVDRVGPLGYTLYTALGWLVQLSALFREIFVPCAEGDMKVTLGELRWIIG